MIKIIDRKGSFQFDHEPTGYLICFLITRDRSLAEKLREELTAIPGMESSDPQIAGRAFMQQWPRLYQEYGHHVITRT